MNRIFKTVWNAVRRCLVVVNETTKNTAQARLGGSLVSMVSVCTLFSPINAMAGNWNPWGTDEWMYPSSSTSNYDNFYWTSSGGARYPWFILGGAHHSRVQNGTINVANEFKMSYGSAIFQLAQPNRESGYTSASGTLNIGGNAYIENGATLNGATSVGGQNTSANATLTVDGTMYLNNGGHLSGGSSSNFGRTYNVNFTINELVIGNKSTFSTGSASNGRFNFNGNFNNITVENGGTFTAHNGGGGLYSTVAIANDLIFKEGSSLVNKKGLVVGESQENFVSVGNNVTFDHATVTENMTLAQKQGTINVAGDGYVFSDFNQTGGVFNNNGDVTFNGALLDAGQFINTGSVSFSGNSTVNKVIEGNGAVNIIGGTFVTDHFENGSVSIQNGVATINQLTESVHHTMTGGELHTEVDEIFGSLGVMGDGELNIIGLTATMPETIRTELTEFFKKYVSGFVKENLDQYASFSGGKIVLKVDSLTENQEADLKAAFKETFASTKY